MPSCSSVLPQDSQWCAADALLGDGLLRTDLPLVLPCDGPMTCYSMWNDYCPFGLVSNTQAVSPTSVHALGAFFFRFRLAQKPDLRIGTSIIPACPYAVPRPSAPVVYLILLCDSYISPVVASSGSIRYKIILLVLRSLPSTRFFGHSQNNSSYKNQKHPTFRPFRHFAPTASVGTHTIMLLAPNHSNLHNNNNSFLDIDSEIQSQSLSSSPQSTISSIPVSAFDNLPTTRIPRAVQEGSFHFAAAPPSPPPSATMLYSDAWGTDNKGTTRGLHNRDTSLSSVGSYGPQSPFSFNSAHPQIAISDASDGFQSLQLPDDQSYQLVAKAPPPPPYYATFPYSAPAALPPYSNMDASQKSRGGGGDRNSLLPAPEFSNGGSNPSRPASVASSVAGDSPVTPVAPEHSGEDEKRRKAGEQFSSAEGPPPPFTMPYECPDSPTYFDTGLINVPKLDRTMTDVYADELYNPDFSVSTTSPSQPSSTSLHMSPMHEIFSQRLQAANDQHLSTTQSPLSSVSRGRSPFKQSSPLAPAPSRDFPQASNNEMRLHPGPQLSRVRLPDSVPALRPTIPQAINNNNNTTSPRTISPQDALLEFNNDADTTNNFPLFPSSQNSFDTSQLSKAASQAHNFGSLSLDTTFDDYMTPQLSAGLQMPHQYPFVSNHKHQSSVPSVSNGSFSVSSRVGTSPSVSPPSSTSPQRPEHVGADGGTYTCTYHGCTQRFETPALLQKHKREGHRQSHGLTGLRRPEGPTAATYFNTQAGPHKCDRINPSTGKPCQTVFSRPYDLTRHEDTIHNARKQKVRCDVCTEEKTFSRADALTRHYRVCHPDLEIPGKHRKRGSTSTASN